MTFLPELVCCACGRTYPVASLAWRCGCGGLFDISAFAPTHRPKGLQPEDTSMWHFADVLPVPLYRQISLGEGFTPLVPSPIDRDVTLKCDFLMPTSSFKDRGAVVLATTAARLGVRAAITDSSGNAGTAAAAYFARAGIPLRVFVPASTPPGKLAQMHAQQAQVTLVPGDRSACAAAALEAAGEPGVLYASHVYHPYFVHGVKTYGYEIWEQLGRRAPETVVVPVGKRHAGPRLLPGIRRAESPGPHRAGAADRRRPGEQLRAVGRRSSRHRRHSVKPDRGRRNSDRRTATRRADPGRDSRDRRHRRDRRGPAYAAGAGRSRPTGTIRRAHRRGLLRSSGSGPADRTRRSDSCRPAGPPRRASRR